MSQERSESEDQLLFDRVDTLDLAVVELENRVAELEKGMGENDRQRRCAHEWRWEDMDCNDATFMCSRCCLKKTVKI